MMLLLSRDALGQFLALQIKVFNRLCERCNRQLFPVTMTASSKCLDNIRRVPSQKATFLNKGDGYRADLWRPLSNLTLTSEWDHTEGLSAIILHNIFNIQRKRANIAHKQLLRGFSTTALSLIKKKENMPAPSNRNIQKHVLVFSSDQTLVGKMTLSRAESMARTDGLKLIDMGVNADKEECYKLVTGKEYFELSMKTRVAKSAEKKKEEKEFRMTAKISDHDLGIKLNQIRDFLQKGRHVKISMKANRRITETEANHLQSNLLKKVVENIQDIATVKKAVKASTDLTFVLIPNPREDTS